MRELLFEERTKLNKIIVQPIDSDDKAFDSKLPLMIGYRSYFTSGMIRHLDHIGRYCSVADNVSIGAAQHPTNWLSTHPFQYSRYHNPGVTLEFSSGKKPATIGNDVWIGANVTINAAVHIGDGAIIASGSVVTTDIPPYTIFGGIPARFLRPRFSTPVIDRLLAIQWWNYQEDSLIGLPFDTIEKCLDQIEERIASGTMIRQCFTAKKLSDVLK